MRGCQTKPNRSQTPSWRVDRTVFVSTFLPLVLVAAWPLLPGQPSDSAFAQPSTYPQPQGGPARDQGQPNHSQQSNQSRRSVPAAIPTNQATFQIPIEVHQHPERIAEFQLLVSNDQGANWSIYQTRPPQEKNFLFQGEQDGEYWFAMRTVDRNRQVSPPGMPQPELVVQLDTQKPSVRLEAVVGQAGSIITRWQATDPSLVADSLRLQYRAVGGLLSGRNEWLPIAAEPGQLGRQGELQGQHNWWPEIAANTIEIRLEVLDSAGNAEVVTRRLDVPRVARQLSPNVPQRAQTSQEQSNASLASTQANRQLQNRQAQNGVNWPSQEVGGSQAAGVQPDNYSSRNPAATANANLAPQNSVPASTASTQRVVASTQPTTTAGQALQEPNLQAPLQPSSPHQFQSPSDFNAANGGIATDNNQRTSTVPALPNEGVTRTPPPAIHIQNQVEPSTSDRQPAASHSIPDSTPRQPVLSPTSPPVTNRSPATRGDMFDSNALRATNDQPREQVQNDLERFSLPAGEYALISNRRQFRLTYEVDSIREESVDRVELWMTNDGGNTWEAWAEDPDRQSPFPVEVPSEGIFGFKIVVHSRDGFSGITPNPGDLADVWVEIDMTRPVAEIVSAPLGTGPETGKLVIQWRASDRKLAARPITLSYSETLSGPWHVIGAGMENTGTYAWRVDANTPKQLFLRIEARDRAGNTCVHDLTTPVDLRRLNPTGRIIGIDDSERAAPNRTIGLQQAPFRRWH